MARLERGEDPKIDKVNDLVYLSMCGNRDSFGELLIMFKPMILSLCSKWRAYFNDANSLIKPWDELVSDAEYWFMHYTLYKYDINGAGTYNTFIKQHIDQRVRYIYECELRYYKHNIFPDPDKSGEREDDDALERVMYNYKSDHGESLENDVICDMNCDSRKELAHKILDMMNNSMFSSRDKLIFTEIVYNGRTHEELSRELNVSRTRITQILKKIKVKLYKLMSSSQEIWDLVNETDIEFREM